MSRREALSGETIKVFSVWNEIGEYPEKRRLSGAGSAADKQRLSAANLLG